MDQPLISVVAPVFNEEKILPEFYRRIAAALNEFRFEIILVDDGSRDSCWDIIQELTAKDPRVRGFRLSRNFGHQSALNAGITQAKGEAVVMIDSDLQDPPELIVKMIEAWRTGHDVVHMEHAERKGETWFKKKTASLFYYLMNRTSQVSMPLESGDFKLLSRKALNSILLLPERVRYLRGLACWVGYSQTTLPYNRDERVTGYTHYSFLKMFKLAWDGLSSFSVLPLQLSTILGLLTTSSALLLAVYSLIMHFFTAETVKGWSSLMLALLLLGGTQLIMIGIVGEYLARIYEEVKQRPPYIIAEVSGSAGK